VKKFLTVDVSDDSLPESFLLQSALSSILYHNKGKLSKADSESLKSSFLQTIAIYKKQYVSTSFQRELQQHGAFYQGPNVNSFAASFNGFVRIGDFFYKILFNMHFSNWRASLKEEF
jgi:hypothetical protein